MHSQVNSLNRELRTQVSDNSRSASSICMVGVEEGREFRFRGDLHSQESTFPLVNLLFSFVLLRDISILVK